MEPKNEGLEDEFHFQTSDFQVNHTIFCLQGISGGDFVVTEVRVYFPRFC